MPSHYGRRFAFAGLCFVLACGSSDVDSEPPHTTQSNEFWSDCDGKPVCACGAPCAGKAVQVTAGAHHSCVRYESGGVLCWGLIRGVTSDPSAYRADNGPIVRIGDDRLPAAVPPKGLDHVVKIAAGNDHSCALRKDGTVWCWGRNEDGQLGIADQSEREEHPVPLRVPDLKDVIELAAGEQGTSGVMAGARYFSLADWAWLDTKGTATLTSEGGGFRCRQSEAGRILCWGTNDEGQVGDGVADPSHYTGFELPEPRNVVALESGIDHSCALTHEGAVWCWGSNNQGALGIGTRSATSEPPRLVSGLPRISAIRVNAWTSCAVDESGQLFCWGADWTNFLRLNDPFGNALVPKAIPDAADIVDLDFYANHGCLIRRSGEVACWGSDDFGATGPRAMKVEPGRLQVLADLPGIVQH